MYTAEAASSGAGKERRPGCVVMAAGAASRFGSNKLLAPLYGKPLYQYLFDTLPEAAFARIVVVSGTQEILRDAENRGFIPVVNVQPEEGAALTIRLGLRHVLDLPACLFCVCDQPGLKRETVEYLCRGPADKICAASYAGVRGNPVLFPASFYNELMTLDAGESGSAVIRRHPDQVLLIPCADAAEMKDVDTRQDLQQLSRRFP